MSKIVFNFGLIVGSLGLIWFGLDGWMGRCGRISFWWENNNARVFGRWGVTYAWKKSHGIGESFKKTWLVQMVWLVLGRGDDDDEGRSGAKVQRTEETDVLRRGAKDGRICGGGCSENGRRRWSTRPCKPILSS